MELAQKELVRLRDLSIVSAADGEELWLGVVPNSSGQAGRDKRRQGTVARVVACRLRCEEVSSPRWHRMWSTVAKK
jgi:hypothetical protein